MLKPVHRRGAEIAEEKQRLNIFSVISLLFFRASAVNR
jgi:hypothetical protein